jgi:putative intracellular protease/amidase
MKTADCTGSFAPTVDGALGADPAAPRTSLARRGMLALFAASALAACAGGSSGPAVNTSSSSGEKAEGPSSNSTSSASTRSSSKEAAMKNRILIALTSHDKKGSTGESTGAYLPEIAHPNAVFVKAGYEVEFASVKGGKVPLDGVDRNDPVSAAFLDDADLTQKLAHTPASSAIEPGRYAAIFFAGGHGAMWDLPDDASFARATTRIWESNGIVGAVCHGPAALVNVRLSSGDWLVAGKTVSAFTNDEERAVKLDRVVPFLLEDRLTARGARVERAPNWQSKVVVTDRLVTGQNPASAAGVAEAMVTLLNASKAR